MQSRLHSVLGVRSFFAKRMFFAKVITLELMELLLLIYVLFVK